MMGVAVEHSVVVMTALSQSRQSKIESMGSQFSIPVFMLICVQNKWVHKVLRSWLRTPALAVQVPLQLGWNNYLHFNSDSELLCRKPMKGRQKALFY